jgi:predicted DNA binding CopG/RHH family protein
LRAYPESPSQIGIVTLAKNRKICQNRGINYEERIFMIIQITNDDLERMPSSLSVALLQWIQSKRTKTSQQASSSAREAVPRQLDLSVGMLVADSKKSQPHSVNNVTLLASTRQPQQDESQDLRENSQVRISQLFDMGLLSEKTQIRVRLKHDKAKQVGYGYAVNVQVSARGTLIYQDEEFDRPSPLATKVNGSAVNGWEYVEIKRNGQWICINELRKVWRRAL